MTIHKQVFPLHRRCTELSYSHKCGVLMPTNYKSTDHYCNIAHSLYTSSALALVEDA